MKCFMRFELFTIGGLNTCCQNGDKTGRRGWNKISDRNSREFKPKASRHTEQVEGRNHRFQHHEFVLNSDHQHILPGQKREKGISPWGAFVIIFRIASVCADGIFCLFTQKCLVFARNWKFVTKTNLLKSSDKIRDAKSNKNSRDTFFGNKN